MTELNLLPVSMDAISTCFECGHPLMPSKTITNQPSKWFSSCSNPICNTLYNTGFFPTDYQLDLESNDDQIIAYFGGYGGGKTVSSGFKFFLHAITVPNATMIAGSNTWKMNNETIIKELIMLIPKEILQSYKYTPSEKAPVFVLDFLNGAKMSVLVYQNEEKLRSFNLTAAWMEEASTLKLGIFNQLKSRMRSDAGKVYAKNDIGENIIEEYVDERGYLRTRLKELKPNYLLIISSNPDPGWIRTKVAGKTLPGKLKYYGPNKEILETISNGSEIHTDYDPFLSTYVVSTRANHHLPTNFIAQLIAGKDKAWIDRYVEGSFAFADGLVYENYSEHLVKPFKIPDKWKRIISTDFGRRDPLVHLIAAQDPESKIWYVYDEYYRPKGEMEEWLEGFKKMYDVVPESSWLMDPVADPAGQSKGQAVSTSWFQLFEDHGIFYQPWRSGQHQKMGVVAGIAKVKDYLHRGKLKIFNNLSNTIQEFGRYTYNVGSLMEDDDGQISEIPNDRNNHAMDALRGIVSWLPNDTEEDIEVYFGEMSTNVLTLSRNFDVDNVEADHPLHPDFWNPPGVKKREEGVYIKNEENDYEERDYY